MGLIKTLIIIAICIAICFILFSYAQIPEDEYECLEEIAEDYCEDNSMVFYRVSGRSVFMCAKNDRQMGPFKSEWYRFLEDEIEECKIAN